MFFWGAVYLCQIFIDLFALVLTPAFPPKLLIHFIKLIIQTNQNTTKQNIGALFALKRKKLYEAEIDKIANIKMTLETQVMNLESAAQNAATMQAMKSGTAQMKKIRQETDIDQVDDLMDEIKEEMEMADEISNALAQPVDPLLTDEDELLAELEELEAEDVTEQLLEPMKKMELPDVPNTELPSIKNATKEEEAELKQLEAELAGL
jgi:charged multivesicular body protein 4